MRSHSTVLQLLRAYRRTDGHGNLMPFEEEVECCGRGFVLLHLEMKCVSVKKF